VKTDNQIVDKEKEVAALVAEQVAEKERLWKEREENMKILLEDNRKETKRVVTSLTMGDISDEDPYLTVSG
jgi:hypothetical protein